MDGEAGIQERRLPTVGHYSHCMDWMADEPHSSTGLQHDCVIRNTALRMA